MKMTRNMFNRLAWISLFFCLCGFANAETNANAETSKDTKLISAVQTAPEAKQVKAATTARVANKASAKNHSQPASHTPHLLDEVVAVVNDDVITLQELRQHEIALKSQFAKKGARPSEDALQKQVLFQLIDQTLQLQLAEQIGLDADDADIDDAIALISKNKKVTSAEFEKEIVASGMSRSAFREQVRTEVLINRLQQKEIGSRIIISEKEIDNYMTTLASIENSKKSQDELDLFNDNAQLKDNPKVRAQMRDLIYRRKFEQNLQNWLAEVRDSAYIKIVDARFSDVMSHYSR